jgi:hypothetical protein
MRPKIDDPQELLQTSMNPFVDSVSGRSPEPTENKFDRATRYYNHCLKFGHFESELNRSSSRVGENLRR